MYICTHTTIGAIFLCNVRIGHNGGEREIKIFITVLFVRDIVDNFR